MTREAFRDRLRRLRKEAVPSNVASAAHEPAESRQLEPSAEDHDSRGNRSATAEQEDSSRIAAASATPANTRAIPTQAIGTSAIELDATLASAARQAELPRDRSSVFARLESRTARARQSRWVTHPRAELGDRRSDFPGDEPPSDSPGSEAARAARHLTLGPPADLVTNAVGPAHRLEHLELASRHGSFALAEYFSAERTALAQLARDPRILELDLAHAVFLDTETTGLSGGTGTYVFLVGLGRFVGERWESWQGFLQHPADERALLSETAERIRAASLVISFFGKSFDRHRLEDKMRVHGIAPPFEERVHLDLYYPLRRLYRGAFENCRLKTLERELCGVARADDLPGSFAPAAWFDFLAGRAHRLEGVFRHNRDDVLSLATLAAHLGRVAAGARADGTALAGPEDRRATWRADAAARADR